VLEGRHAPAWREVAILRVRLRKPIPVRTEGCCTSVGLGSRACKVTSCSKDRRCCRRAPHGIRPNEGAARTSRADPVDHE
jgi:hypothetical protein